MSSRVDSGPVHAEVAMTPAVWNGVCVLAERAGELPGEWLQQAVRDHVEAELALLPDRLPLPDGEQGEGYGIGV